MASIRETIKKVFEADVLSLEVGLTPTGVLELREALIEAIEETVKSLREPERETLGFIRSTISDYDRDGMRELGFIAIKTLLKGGR